MRLGYYDRAQGGNRVKVYWLPRKQGESRSDYSHRFFAEIRGLGNCGVRLIRGQRYGRTVLRRGF